MIRLQRVGKKHDPSFRVVLVDSRRGPKSGNFIKILGSYNAQKGEPQFKEEEIKAQIANGTQVSDTVHNLLVKAGIVKGKTKDVSAKNEKKKAPKEETKPQPETDQPSAEAKEEPTPAPEDAKEEKKEEKPEENKQEESA